MPPREHIIWDWLGFKALVILVAHNESMTDSYKRVCLRSAPPNQTGVSHWLDRSNIACCCRSFSTNHMKLVNPTRVEIENASGACQTASIYFSMSNYTRREVMSDTPHGDNVKLRFALFSCVCWQHLSEWERQCADGWLSVLSDYFCCLYFPFEPRKTAAKLLTSEPRNAPTMCLVVPFPDVS